MGKRLLILNTDDKECAYGGICPFMRNMHPFLADSFIVDYLVLPNSWKKMPGPVRFYYLVYLLLNFYKFGKFDFILSHAVEGSYVSSFTKIPYAHIYHGNSNPVEFSRFSYGKYFMGLYEMMFRRIERTASILYSVGPLRNEKQKKLFNPLIQNIKPLPVNERKGFVFAGRLEIVKNIDRLISLYSKLPLEIRKENAFYIIGFGTLDSKLKQFVHTLNMTDYIFFLGKVDNSQMMKVISDKRVMLMASSTEGFPTAIAEAFSVGLPIVTTNVGDIRSIVRDKFNGRLLESDYSDNEYIDCIKDVLDNYDSYAQKAFETSKFFDCENITRDVVCDILSVINKKSNG